MIGVGGQGAEGRGFLFTPGLYAGSLVAERSTALLNTIPSKSAPIGNL